MSAVAEEPASSLDARIEDLERELPAAKAELGNLTAENGAKPVVDPAKVPRWARFAFAGPVFSLLTRFPATWVLPIITAFLFVGGTILRWHYVVNWHDPRKFVYLDMRMYVDLARRLSAAPAAAAWPWATSRTRRATRGFSNIFTSTSRRQVHRTGSRRTRFTSTSR